MPVESVRDFATRFQANWQNAQLGRSCDKGSMLLKFEHFLDNLKPEQRSITEIFSRLDGDNEKGLIALKSKHFFFKLKRSYKDNLDAPRHGCPTRFPRHGCPEGILTGQGTQFTSNNYKELCAKFGIKQHLTTSYYHQFNGEDDRFMRFFDQKLSNSPKCDSN
jgi:hypothetical protein